MLKTSGCPDESTVNGAPTEFDLHCPRSSPPECAGAGEPPAPRSCLRLGWRGASRFRPRRPVLSFMIQLPGRRQHHRYAAALNALLTGGAIARRVAARLVILAARAPRS